VDPLPAGPFAAWGRLMYRWRRPVVALAALTLPPAVWVILLGAPFETGHIPVSTESGQALALMEAELPGAPPTFNLILGDPGGDARAPGFRAAVEDALAPLRRDPRVARVRTPWDVTPPDPGRIARDGRRVLVVVELHGRASPFSSVEFASLATAVYPDLRALVRSDRLEILPAGDVPLSHDFHEVTRRDLVRAELVILPVVLGLLVLVFGSVLAASLPLGTGLLAVTAGVAATTLLGRVTSVSIYASNIVTMIGFGVAIDYALFVVTRFREELAERPVADAVERAVATAGRTVFFSGLTVAIGLLGMLLLRLGNLGTMGLTGTGVVALSVLYSLTFLPALLGMLGPRVDRLRVPFLALRPAGGETAGLWYRIASVVCAHPWRVLLPVAALLLLLGSPVLRLRLSSADATALPATADSRRGDAVLRAQFPGHDVTRLFVVLRYAEGSPLGAERMGQTYDLSRWIARLPDVARVESVVDLDPSITREQYQMLGSAPPDMVPAEIREALRQLAGERLTVLVVSTPRRAGSEEARQLVRTLRTAPPPPGATLMVSGLTAFDVDFNTIVREDSPRVIAFVVVATYVVLFFLLGSVLLPVKAVLMNVLSISASYGALVWLFQDGHLAGWLDFTPGPIETVTPIIMFCVLFGLSMDYEVLLLARVREEYEASGDTSHAVAAALARTGRLITGAAAIMACVFFSFGASGTVVVKAIGIGMGIAVVIDATIVRALVVPATMQLMGRWNWWAPAIVRRWAPRPHAGPPAAPRPARSS
jgi:RND superfamily putative drug exporter